MHRLPEQFSERLRSILPEEHLKKCLDVFGLKNSVCIRVNTLKAGREQVIEELIGKAIPFREVSWCKDALVLDDDAEHEEKLLSFYQSGRIYRQALSSMLPAIILGPNPGDRVLDMCAAPGSKATMLAALMNNKGELICLESVKKRYYKLKSVLTLLGADMAEARLADARRYRDRELFDRILVDVPCSSEARFKTFDKKTFHYWSLRKIKEMRAKQKGLIQQAVRLLKPGGICVYSTCTFAPEENEEVVSWLLKRSGNDLTVDDIQIRGIQTYPAILEWNGREYFRQLKRAVRIMPTQDMEGFFVVKLVKKG